MYRCRSSLCILDINPYLKIFFPSVWVVFSFSWYSNFTHKSFYFDEINIFFLLLPVLLMFNPRSCCQTQYYKDVFPVFSSKGFTALALMLKCMVNFNFCMWCKLRVHLHSLACGHVVFPHCWKEVLSLLNVLVPLLKISWPYMWRFIIGLFYPIYVCLYAISNCFDSYSFVVGFEIRK